MSFVVGAIVVVVVAVTGILVYRNNQKSVDADVSKVATDATNIVKDVKADAQKVGEVANNVAADVKKV